jgi:tripartite-type tricarboxylate transporter receptor subunit TctC
VPDPLARLGLRVLASSPEELATLLGSEIKRWGEVIRRAKIEPE